MCCQREPVNLCLSRNFGRIVRLKVRQGGAAANLAGCSAKLQIRDKAGSVLLTLTSATNDGIVINTGDGTITATITGAQTAASSVTTAGSENVWGFSISPAGRQPIDAITGYCTVQTPPVVP